MVTLMNLLQFLHGRMENDSHLICSRVRVYSDLQLAQVICIYHSGASRREITSRVRIFIYRKNWDYRDIINNFFYIYLYYK